MLKFLKDIMKGGGEPAGPAPLTVGELPAWIQAEEGKVWEELAGLVKARRPRVADAIRTTKEVLARFDRVEMEEVSHRKLAGVTEKSLPLFVKAMGTSLSRELPDDPEGFYMATAEILKGCLSAFRGQGRYLSSRFPVEMKTLRVGVDTIGREANAMTPGISQARQRLHALGELRRALDGYLDAKGRATLAREELGALGREESGSRESLESAQRALAGLMAGEEYRTCEGELARIRVLEEERDSTARLYRGTASAAIHLLGKGEKIASRKKDREAARFLHEAIALLERELPLTGDQVGAVLGRGQEALANLAASGDLVPKNREETVLLGEPGHLAREVEELSLAFSRLSGGIASAMEAVHARPALAKCRELGKEREALEKRIGRTRERLEQVKTGGAELDARVEAAFKDLQERVGALSAGSAALAEPGTAG
jgi:hypothetical protein